MTRDDFEQALNDYSVAYHDFMSADNIVARSSARREMNATEDLLLAEFDRLTAKANQQEAQS